MSLKKVFFLGIPALIAALLFVAVIVPSVRTTVQDFFASQGREVLATAEGDLLSDGSVCKVVKIRAKDGIFVEVLKMDGQGATTLVDRVELPDKHDGMFNYQGQVTRLAIVDVDHDGRMELLAPTFDSQLVPHLNVFRYNSESRKFELFQGPK